MLPITRTLARHVARVTYAELPEGAVRAAKQSLLDALGVSLAASGIEPACAPFVELATESAGPCQILGFGRRSTPLMAACANGALAHALDYEDAFDGTPAHPNAASVPVALALADSDPKLDGKALITALSVGCDVTCRLALALTQNPDDLGFYTPPILGAFGAAVTAAKLLALNEDQIVACFGLTLTQAMCSSQFKRDSQSDLRAVRDAFAAHAGLMAASLAARGVRGFEAAFEGEHGLYALYARGAYDPELLLRELGERFLGEQVSFKPWPSCRGTHAFVEAALQLRAAHAPEDVGELTAYGAALNLMLAEPLEQKRRPATSIDAKFSIPFCVASAFVRGGLGLNDFTPDALRAREVLDLAQRVLFVPDPGAGMRDATRGRLRLITRSGQVREVLIDMPLGHPQRPLTDAQLLGKFTDCAGRARLPLTAARAQRAAQAILSIEHSPSAREALALLT